MSARKPPSPAAVPAAFGSVGDLVEFFRRRTGAGAPFLERGHSAAAVRTFLQRILTVLLHPQCSDRALFFAQARRARALVQANIAPSTAASVLQIRDTFPDAFTAAKINLDRVAELHAIHFPSYPPAAAATSSSDSPADTVQPAPGPPPQLVVTKADASVLDNIAYRLSRGAEDTAVSARFAAFKAAERALIDFRSKISAAPGGTAWLKDPDVSLRVRAAKRAAAAAGDLSGPEAEGGGAPAADATPAANDAAAKEEGEVEKAKAAPKFGRDDAERAAALGEYITLSRAVAEARAAWQDGCPVRGASRQIDTLRDHAYAAFGADPAATGEKAASKMKAHAGSHDGAAMEALVWGAGAPQIALALRAAAANSPAKNEPDAAREGSSLDGDDITVVDATEAAAMAQCPRFVLVRNVDVRFDGGQLGELDGVIIDCKRQEVALVCEVKKTAADLCYARTQRIRLHDALATAKQRQAAKDAPPVTGAASTEAAAVANSTANSPTNQQGGDGGGRPRFDRKKRYVPATEVLFRVKGMHADSYGQLVKSGAAPELLNAAFDRFRDEPLRRWLFITIAGDRPQDLPVPSKVTHVVVRELATTLAVAGWSPPSLVDIAADPARLDAACVDAQAVFDAVDDDQLRQIVSALAGVWRKVTTGDPEYLYGHGRLEGEVRRTAVNPNSGGFAPLPPPCSRLTDAADAAAGGAEGAAAAAVEKDDASSSSAQPVPVVSTIVAWVDVNLSEYQRAPTTKSAAKQQQ